METSVVLDLHECFLRVVQVNAWIQKALDDNAFVSRAIVSGPFSLVTTLCCQLRLWWHT